MTRWFSAKLRFVCLVEPIGGLEYMDSIYLLNASDFDDAFARAVETGRKNEKEYLNGEGKQVRWKLTKVLSLDALPTGLGDGVEIHSQRVDLDDGVRIPFDATFTPDQFVPEQTI